MGKEKKILVVDDEPDVVDIVKVALESEGYKVFPATGGRQALEIALQEPLDMAILDVAMPDMDGFELCRQLKENENTKHIPVMFLTVKEALAYRLTGLFLGAYTYLTKPFDSKKLLEKVKSCFSKGIERDFE